MKGIQRLGYITLGAVLMFVISMTVPVLAAGVQRQLTAHFNNIRVVVDGNLITPRDGLGNVVEPFVVDGTTYLPVRAVAEALGQTVEWEGTTQTVYIGARPGTVRYLTDVAPAHQSSDVNFRTNPLWSSYREYSAINSGGAERFALGGVNYVDGMIFHHIDTWAVYNLNGQFTSLSGIASQLDEGTLTVATNAAIRFFADGRLVLEVPITADMSPREFSVDLTGVNQLRIATAANYHGNFSAGIGNPVIQ
jgi:hypothetical protein